MVNYRLRQTVLFVFTAGALLGAAVIGIGSVSESVDFVAGMLAGGSLAAAYFVSQKV